MGYWNETCLITNLPILEGDRVVCIEAKTEDDFLCSLESPFWDTVNIAIGEMGDCGNLLTVEKNYIPLNLKNPYEANNTKKFICFVYYDIWKKILDKSIGNRRVENRLNSCNRFFKKTGGVIPDLFVEFLKISGFLMSARAGFSESFHRGSQNVDVSARKIIAEITLEKAAEIESKLRIQLE